MGPRSRLTVASALCTLAAAACASKPPMVTPAPAPPQPSPADVPPPAPKTMPERVAADFEAAIKSGREAYVGLFDFAAVGEIEILLHRYDLYGRLPKLPDDIKTSFAAEDGTPYPAARERHNVGTFYKVLGVRTVGTGGCKAVEPRTHYSKLLTSFPPLPPGPLAADNYEALRTKANAYVAKGGVVGVRCDGGKGGVALVWTERPNQRGYDLITIYDD
jgi:hypothetical protein